MTQYLLDTNICIYLLKNKFGVMQHVLDSGIENCHISEITYAELGRGSDMVVNHERCQVCYRRFVFGYNNPVAIRNSAGGRTFGVCGKCLRFPVTKKLLSLDRETS